jgi:dTDP-glucose pyrophosphorylase
VKTLILAAGPSTQFEEAGFAWPINLVEMAGTALISHVIRTIGPLATDGQLIAVIRSEEAVAHHTDRVIRLVEPTAEVITVGDTSGAACSALLAIDHIPLDEPLLVCNGDQVIDADLAAIVEDFEGRDIDAGVVVFEAVHPRWSYVRTENGRVVEASEKRPISKNATAGVYWYRKGADFVASIMDMIRKDASVHGRFFVCPSLNELVLRGAVIGVTPIDRSQYFSLHDPVGVNDYIHHLQDRSVGAR